MRATENPVPGGALVNRVFDLRLHGRAVAAMARALDLKIVARMFRCAYACVRVCVRAQVAAAALVGLVVYNRSIAGHSGLSGCVDLYVSGL